MNIWVLQMAPSAVLHIHKKSTSLLKLFLACRVRQLFASFPFSPRHVSVVSIIVFSHLIYTRSTKNTAVFFDVMCWGSWDNCFSFLQLLWSRWFVIRNGNVRFWNLYRNFISVSWVNFNEWVHSVIMLNFYKLGHIGTSRKFGRVLASWNCFGFPLLFL